MANILGELFQNQANAIREGLGDIGGIAPLETPSLIRQIVSMIGTGEGGNSGGTIVDGKGNVKFASGTFDTTTEGVNRQVIYHGLDDYPDFIAVFATWMGADASDYTKEDHRIAAIYGVSSDYSSAAFQCRTCYVNGSNIDSDGNKWDGDSWSAIDDGDPSLHPLYTYHHTIYTPTYNKFYVGWNESVEAGKGKYLFLPNTVYRWVAISGIGSTGGGSADGCVTVTFMNGNTEPFSRPVYIGDDCPNPVDQKRIETPTKDSTAQYDYTYNGWSLTDGGDASASALTNVREDRTVYAAFRADARKYTITWLDEDGTELPGQKQWAYGTVPSYTPSKDGAIFGGWTPTPVAVTGDATYTVVWSTIVASGNCGANTTNVTWELDSAGTLTLVGSGKIKDYKNPISYPNNAAPWYSYRSQITKIVVGSGITNISAFCFHQLTNVESITLPNSITSIGESGIRNNKITSLVLPSNLTSIGNYGLSSLKLTNLTIPSKVSSIGASAFHLTKFTSVVFENPNGWWVSTDSAATSGEAVTVTDPETAATLLNTTYKEYYWKRT